DLHGPLLWHLRGTRARPGAGARYGKIQGGSPRRRTRNGLTAAARPSGSRAAGLLSWGLPSAPAKALARACRVDGTEQLGWEIHGEEHHHRGLQRHLLDVMCLVRAVKARHVVAVVLG